MTLQPLLDSIRNRVGASTIQPQQSATAYPVPESKTKLYTRRDVQIVFAVILLIGASWWYFGGPPDSSDSQQTSRAPSIAVLPLENLSDDSGQDWFADGISQDLITELSRYDGLLVIAHNSTIRFKGQAADVSEVARTLGVNYVLKGGIQRAGEVVRITAQLIDTETGGYLWAERYERELVDIFEVQDNVTREIIDALQTEIGYLSPTRNARSLTTSLTKPTTSFCAHGARKRDERNTRTPTLKTCCSKQLRWIRILPLRMQNCPMLNTWLGLTPGVPPQRYWRMPWLLPRSRSVLIPLCL